MYAIHRLLWDIRRDARVKTRYAADAATVLDEYGIEGDFRVFMETLYYK